uniref:Uncharacterized protein n=1 Tax=Setaria digitata TaxID=48799 RepID=A0A915PYP2_9BILA
MIVDEKSSGDWCQLLSIIVLHLERAPGSAAWMTTELETPQRPSKHEDRRELEASLVCSREKLTLGGGVTEKLATHQATLATAIVARTTLYRDGPVIDSSTADG